MPKTLYLSTRELATVVAALDLYAVDPTKLSNPETLALHTAADRAGAAILRDYATKVAASDDFDAVGATDDRLRDQWYAGLRPDLAPCVPPSEQEPAT